MFEYILQKIAEKVISYVLDQSQIRIEGWARTKLGLEPTQQAFKHALSTAFNKFEQSYPQWSASLFDADFLEKEGASILAQFLLRDGHPDASQLATLWADSLNIHKERRIILTRELEPVAADFLDYLAQALRAEPELSEVNDSRVLEQLTIDLKAIRGKFGAEKATPGTRRDYLRWMIERYLYIDPRGTLQTHRQVQLKLDDVYISLRAHNDIEQGQADLDTLMVSKNLFANEIDEESQSSFSSPASSETKTTDDEQEEILELAEVVNRHDRVVLLGEPGSGKSTLLRYLALKHAKALWDSQFEAGSGLGTTRFPIRVRIADYAERGMPGTSLSDFLADYCITRECPKTGLADLMATELGAGNCLILLDGLDEVVSADIRRSTVQQIEDFVRRHCSRPNRFVITSRIAGYSSAPLGVPFAQYTLQEMDEAQIHHFLERWCRAVEDSQTPELSAEVRRAKALQEVASIMKAVHASPGVRRLAANPLLLRILALIQRTGAQLPQKRIELYKLAAETLTRTWRTAQGVPESALALLKDQYLTPLLGKLAHWLHVNKPTGIANEREVYEVLGKEWADLNGLPWDPDMPNPKIKSEVDEFLVAVREQTGIFVERAPNRYGFMHLTFEEYYTARYLIARSKTRAKLIRQHLHDPRWDEPILLALGLIGSDSPIEASELLEMAILAEGEDAKELGFTPNPYEDLLGRDYLFALRCLGDHIPAHPILVRRLIRRQADEMLYRTGSARFQRYQLALEERLKHLNGSEGASEFIPFLVAALDDPDSRVRLRTVQIAEQLGQFSSEMTASMVRALYDHDFNVRFAAAQSLKQLEWVSDKVITTLLNTLSDSDPRMRSWSAESLGQLGQTRKEVVTGLLGVLNDDDSEVRRAAVESLGQLGQANDKVITALLYSLHDDDVGVCSAAAESLGKLGQATDKVITALLHSLHSKENSLRYKAAQSLGQLKSSSEVVTALLNALHDPDPRVRRTAGQSLGLLEQGSASNEVVAALLNILLHDPVPWVRNQALESLEQLGQVSNEVVNSLLTARTDVDFLVRRSALQSLRRLMHESDDVVDALLNVLHDPDPIVRRTATEGLGLLERGHVPIKVVTALLDSLSDPASSVRRQTVESLGQLGQTHPEVLATLIKTLRDPSPDVRGAAVRSLEKMYLSAQEVLAVLTNALHDTSPDVSYQAAISLAKLGQASPEIVAMLLVTLQNAESWPYCRDAALLIGQLGQSNISTIQPLLRELLNRHSLVRAACAQALSQLGQRYPSTAETIATELVRAIEDPEFNRPDDSIERRPAYDYAFDGLWQLKVMKATS